MKSAILALIALAASVGAMGQTAPQGMRPCEWMPTFEEGVSRFVCFEPKPSPILVLPNGDAILWIDVTHIVAYPETSTEDAKLYGRKAPPRVVVAAAGDRYYMTETKTFVEAKRQRDRLIDQWKKAITP